MRGTSRVRTALHAVMAGAMMLTVLAIVEVATGGTAGAFIPPIADSGPGHVTADALPTVQINGVVWDQAIIGNTAYAVGSFTSARPAGSPAGSNETPKSNILAYDLTTGALKSTFTASLNAQGKTVTAAPDGSRIYVGGEFTSVNGVTRYRIAALDPTTGAVIQGFNAVVGYRVNKIVATSTTVYAGGAFTGAGPGATTTRNRLAAFAASNGALLNWNPSADAEVSAMVLTPDGSRMIVGGRFLNLNGASAIGMGSVDAVTGASMPWAINQIIQDGGQYASILTLNTDGRLIYGAGYVTQASGGNMEGSWAADPMTGQIQFLEDCHADTYSLALMNGYEYKVDHTHYCANIGGWPQPNDWVPYMRHAISFTTAPAGTVRRDPWNYTNWEGYPAPSLVNWFPEWQVGTYTGIGQAGWTVTGNGRYLLIGGEFKGVNGTNNQQGLVRFAVKGIAPAKQGPRLFGSTFPINVSSPAAGQARISFAANWDRDSLDLRYRIVRDGDTANPIYTTTVAGTYWDHPTISYTDTGLAPGSTHTYRVYVNDDDGNQQTSDTTSLTISGSGAPSPYSDAVMADGARLHYRLGEPAGSTTVRSAVAFNDGTVGPGGVTFGQPGALLNDPNTGVTMLNSNAAEIWQNTLSTVSDNLSTEIWFKTGSGTGGRLIGMGSAQQGTSGQTDRLLYLTNGGSVVWGAQQANPGPGKNKGSTRQIVQSQAGLNDNQWHHVVGTLGQEGLNLYVDGVRVASRGDVMRGAGYAGYWRVGWDSLANWPQRPSNDHFIGQLDEAAIYETQLTAQQVAAHYAASGRTPNLPPTPGDPYGALIHNSDPYLYYRLAEPSGTTAADSGIRANTGDYVNTVGRGAPGVIGGNAAAQFTGNGFVASRTQLYSPTNWTLESWFKTTTNTGGEIIGFGDSRTGTSTNADRRVYMRDNGQLTFSVLPTNASSVTSPAAYNDGQWHHVAATQDQSGMKLYVDGTLVGTNAQVLGGAYFGYWRVGGDNTGGGSTSNYFNGTIDEAAVYGRVLSAADIANHVTAAGQTVTSPPTASFTSSADKLAVSFTSTSTDPDGTIVSSVWNFGDGSPTSTATNPNHTYAAAGTYNVTLTVTDNDNQSTSVTQPVTVKANVPPVAAFTSQVAGLDVNFTNTSSDSDGTIASTVWDFGDGSPTSTATNPSHHYAAAGTYNVTLTVTDDDGAVTSITQAVNPATFVTLAADSFSRTVAGAFGVADTGGTWTLSGTPANFSVGGGVGRMVVPAAGQTRGAYLPSVGTTDVDSRVDLALDSAPTGGGTYVTSVVRRNGTNDYRIRIKALPGSTQLQLLRMVSGTPTTIASVNLNGVNYAANSVIHFRLQAIGTGTTTLQGKVWFDAAPEPANWMISGTDTTAALQAAGGVGTEVYLSGTATTVPVTMTVDNLLVTNV